jgi:predicted Zn-dependent protease
VIPSRQYLGRVHLLAGKPADAQRAFEADLDRFPENVWSLRGLAESLEKQGKTAEAQAVQARVEKALQGTGGAGHRH